MTSYMTDHGLEKGDTLEVRVDKGGLLRVSHVKQPGLPRDQAPAAEAQQAGGELPHDVKAELPRSPHANACGSGQGGSASGGANPSQVINGGVGGGVIWYRIGGGAREEDVEDSVREAEEDEEEEEEEELEQN